MSATIRLTPDQKHRIAEWLDDGYTPTQIVRKIDKERLAGVRTYNANDADDEGELWPSLTREAVEWHRKRRGDLAPDRETAISVVSGTMLGTRAAHLRRLAEQAGKLEDLMDEVYSQLMEEVQAGALRGVPIMELHQPSFVQAEYAVDGVSMGLSSVRSEEVLPEVVVDEGRAKRAIFIMNSLQGLYVAWERLMTNAQKVGGLHNTLTKDEHSLAVSAEQNATVRRLYESFSRSNAQREG